MTPIPQNNRARLWVAYTACGIAHEVLVHLQTGADETSAAAIYDLLKAGMRPIIASNDSVTGARFSAAGSNVSFPIDVTAGAGTNAAWSDKDRGACFLAYSGRGVDGRRTKFTLFANGANPDESGYRIKNPSGAALDLLEVLQESEAAIVAVSGATIVWNTWLNQGYNAYWQRQLRKLNAS